MFQQMNTHDWVQLPIEVRAKLAEKFNIPRSGYTHVVGNKVETDGYTNENLAKMSIEALRAYTGADSQDFTDLFKLTLIKIYEELKPPEVLVNGEPPEVEANIEKTPEQLVEEVVGKAPFCDSCESKGVRHLKTCLKNKVM